MYMCKQMSVWVYLLDFLIEDLREIFTVTDITLLDFPGQNAVHTPAEESVACIAHWHGRCVTSPFLQYQLWQWLKLFEGCTVL